MRNLFIEEKNSNKPRFISLKKYISELNGKTNLLKTFIKKNDNYKLIEVNSNTYKCINTNDKNFKTEVTFLFVHEIEDFFKSKDIKFDNIFLDYSTNHKYPFLKNVLEEKYNIKIEISKSIYNNNDIFSITPVIKYLIDLNNEFIQEIYIDPFNSKNINFSYDQLEKVFNTKEELLSYIKNNKNFFINKLNSNIEEKISDINCYDRKIEYYLEDINEIKSKLKEVEVK